MKKLLLNERFRKYGFFMFGLLLLVIGTLLVLNESGIFTKAAFLIATIFCLPVRWGRQALWLVLVVCWLF